MRQYEQNMVGNIENASATVDLKQSRIETPVGQFRIYRVEEAAIFFDDPKSQFKVFGRLDRVSGQMIIFWRTAAEEAKMQAGMNSRAAMYAEMTCVAARRIF
jgi:hypothetical protein